MIPKLVLAITGFIPLYALMIFTYLYSYVYQVIDERVKKYLLIVMSIILIVNIISIIILIFYIKDKEDINISEHMISFSDIKENKKAHVDYMMTYLLPLMTFNIDSISGFNILYTNLIIAFFIYVNARGENFSLNLILLLKGFRIYTGKNINGDEKILLIRGKKFSNIKSNQEKCKFVKLAASKDIYICKKYI
ncbi:hypothetical protein QTH22_02440 [Clostridium perfringens]|uniref:hypothetical protein n=1 Tax=Clostridium perfringens TaxID=1502 RepID=UPI0032DB2A50|nr:hypothetical protein [Clostridium perfringens]